MYSIEICNVVVMNNNYPWPLYIDFFSFRKVRNLSKQSFFSCKQLLGCKKCVIQGVKVFCIVENAVQNHALC